jgi:hypothetical protein
MAPSISLSRNRAAAAARLPYRTVDPTSTPPQTLAPPWLGSHKLRTRDPWNQKPGEQVDATRRRTPFGHSRRVPELWRWEGRARQYTMHPLPPLVCHGTFDSHPSHETCAIAMPPHWRSSHLVVNGGVVSLDLHHQNPFVLEKSEGAPTGARICNATVPRQPVSRDSPPSVPGPVPGAWAH